LANIRLAHQSYATWTCGNGSVARLLREKAQNLIENVRAATAVQSRDWPWLAEAEPIELRHIGVHGIRVELIRYQNHWHLGTLQFACHHRVSLRDTHIGIHNEDDDISSFHGHFCLARNRTVNPLGIRVPAAGILDKKALAIPVTDIRNGVTGNAWVVLDNSCAAAWETVDQAGLAHIWTAHNSHRAQLFFSVRRTGHAEGALDFCPLLVGELFARDTADAGVKDLVIDVVCFAEFRLIKVVVEF